ncbi:MAG: ATP-binding cassette domain-containing protein [Polyangiales bacterium]
MNARPLVAALDAVRALPTSAPLTLELRAGERVALLGANGVGKTALLRVLAGLRAPAAGRVVHARAVGYCAQDYRGSLFPWLTARENVALGGRDAAQVAAAAAMTGLTDPLLARRPGHLSGGEQQRIALARAVAGTPTLVLLDEPLSALDVTARAATVRRLAEALSRRPCALVAVTHDLDDARALCPRWVVLAAPDGRVCHDGPPLADRAALAGGAR